MNQQRYRLDDPEIAERLEEARARGFAEGRRSNDDAAQHVRDELRKWKAIVWAIVDANTRRGEPTRIGTSAMAAYNAPHDRVFIECSDVATDELVLFTKQLSSQPQR